MLKILQLIHKLTNVHLLWSFILYMTSNSTFTLTRTTSDSDYRFIVFTVYCRGLTKAFNGNIIITIYSDTTSDT